VREALDKYRINPGNVGKGGNHDKNFATMVAVRGRVRETGAHRRQRRFAGPGAAERADGSEREVVAAAGRDGRVPRSDGAECFAFGSSC
jgi:hypothetical protein